MWRFYKKMKGPMRQYQWLHRKNGEDNKESNSYRLGHSGRLLLSNTITFDQSFVWQNLSTMIIKGLIQRIQVPRGLVFVRLPEKADRSLRDMISAVSRRDVA
jgi:hypothetical protein